MKIKEELLNLEKQSNIELKEIYDNIDSICLKNSERILEAFTECNVSYSDFTDINGYGNYDTGRDKIEKIFATVLGCEDALVRTQIMSGTNAIYLALSALLKYGDTMLSISGTPYDSLQEMIGIIGDSTQSLKASGVKYLEIALKNNEFDKDKIIETIRNNKIKLIEIQRSRGYSSRSSLTIKQIEDIIKVIKEIDKDIIIFVDNCYGELVEEREPGHVGADIVVGSLMKNLGGGIASSGGYVAGRSDLIHMVAERLTAPGIAKEQGANFNQNINFFKGIFMAPSAVRSAIKTAIFASYMLEKLGFNEVSPRYSDYRTDIIQTVVLNNKDNLVEFARGLQAASPVDSKVYITPAPMPGYPFEEVMAAGCFTQGSTIELSADAPVTPPYRLYMQGGLTFEYGKLIILNALNNIKK